MKIAKVAVLMLIVLLATGDLFAQGRNAQMEFYGGAAFPMGPDAFKDFFKVGLSFNAQYVFFPSPRLGIPIFVGYEGFTTDTDALGAAAKDFYTLQLRNATIGRPLLEPGTGDFFGTIIEGQVGDAKGSGSASTIKFGIGLRPYLTHPEAPTQFFLFGTASFNLIKQKQEYAINQVTLVTEDGLGQQFQFDFARDDFQLLQGALELIDVSFQPDSELKDNTEKFGLAGGAGLEIPAGESLNLIVQGLFNVIFTEDESTTFIGVTAGLVF